MITIDSINALAEFMLMLRRQQLGVHIDGYWRGKPNPYSVGNKPRYSDY